jgi:hypothetical protein
MLRWKSRFAPLVVSVALIAAAAVNGGIFGGLLRLLNLDW